MTDGSGVNHMKCNPDMPTVWATRELPGGVGFYFFLRKKVKTGLKGILCVENVDSIRYNGKWVKRYYPLLKEM